MVEEEKKTDLYSLLGVSKTADEKEVCYRVNIAAIASCVDIFTFLHFFADSTGLSQSRQQGAS